MTTTHPDPVQLLALVDGDLAVAGVADHVQACAACQREVETLRAMEGALARADVTKGGNGPGPEVAVRMQSTARGVLMPAPGRRRLAWGLAAAMVVAAVFLAVRHESTPSLQVTAAWTRADGERRGADDRFHFALRLPASGELTVFTVPANGDVRVLFPADDAIVARLGMPEPLPAGELRLPADPLFDFDPGAPTPVAFVIVFSAGAPKPGERQAWLQQLDRAARAGDGAERTANVATAATVFGGVLCQLPAR